MAREENPFASPTGDDAPPPPPPETEATQIRRRHLRTEKSLQSLGQLYCVAGVLLGIVSLIYWIAAFSAEHAMPTATAVLLGLLFAAGAGGSITMGCALATLHPRARIPALILTLVWIFVFGYLMKDFLPLVAFAVLNLYAMFILLGDKAKTILSPAYRKIRAETPHIQYRNSSGRWDF